MEEADFYRNLPCLETERLIIRKYTLEDVDDYFAFASDAEVTRFLRWGPHPNRDYTLEYIQGVLDEYAAGKDSSWGIELRTEKRIIGTMHIMHLDLYHRKAHVGFALARVHWNNGYATEALGKVLEHCFAELSLNRIEAFCIPENRAAVRVLEKAGMQSEGVLRQYQCQKGECRDFELFSILRSDYEAQRNCAGS